MSTVVRTDQKMRELISRKSGVSPGLLQWVHIAAGEDLDRIAEQLGIVRSYADLTATVHKSDFQREYRGEFVSVDFGDGGCDHNMKSYVGFTESYRYCTKCPHKEDVTK